LFAAIAYRAIIVDEVAVILGNDRAGENRGDKGNGEE